MQWNPLPTSGLRGTVEKEKGSGRILEETQVHFQKQLAMRCEPYSGLRFP